MTVRHSLPRKNRLVLANTFQSPTPVVPGKGGLMQGRENRGGAVGATPPPPLEAVGRSPPNFDENCQYKRRLFLF